MGIVRQITDTVSELSSTYSQSKLPKPIKRIIFNHQLNKINKIIDKIPEDGKITLIDLAEFFKDFYKRYYSSNSITSKFDNISVSLEAKNLFKSIDNKEYNVLITLSDKSYIKIYMIYNIDFRHPNIYECSITVRTVDKFNSPISYSTRGFTKYQEISKEVIEKIVAEDQLSDQATQNFNMVLNVLSSSIKQYLKSYIGVYDSINL